MISTTIENQLPIMRHSNWSKTMHTGKGHHIQMELQDFRLRGTDYRESPQ